MSTSFDDHETRLIAALSRYACLRGATSPDDGVSDDHARLLLALFDARLSPLIDDADRSDAVQLAHARLDAAVAKSSATERPFLRTLDSIVRATLRTNYFDLDRTDAGDPISLKLDPSVVDRPSSVPVFREIYVHGPDVEGSHLRGGKIARGGLRWSERPDGFRTEVLGLMRTQMVKNSLIVPLGAKGAFVVRGKASPTPTDVAAAYRQFVSALLDVTEAADPYLVVAADKGTARFSDLANSIAAERNYWLGDAFASGGTQGFDHKAMGITARGGWLAVRRHLAEAGIDVDTNPHTAVGIGDMSGDVFGNGMLRSSHTRLVAAFDHRHIFLDPNPDAARAFAQRQRLYNLPGSNWDDFDRSVISDGGGVWSRSASVIPLSPEVRLRLDIEATSLTPAELIRAILRADVDLLWNGGVGTYVKASTETHADAADPGSDALRVDANTLRCTVIGEGGNLGLTQRARVEYATAGGRVNADFIDNAAGVATSDREVNIKIVLDAAVDAGRLTPVERNDLLAGVIDEVGASVLADCDRQTLALSLAEEHSSFLLDRHSHFIENLEDATGIDRVHEVLPTPTEVQTRLRDGDGLVRPEIAVLLAMSKNLVSEELLASDVPDDPDLAHIAIDYFPASMRMRFADEIAAHPLRREIVAVTLANRIIDRVGPGHIYRVERETGKTTAQIVRDYAISAFDDQLVSVGR